MTDLKDQNRSSVTSLHVAARRFGELKQHGETQKVGGTVEGKDGSTAGSMVVAAAATGDGTEDRPHGRQRGAIGVSTATATAGNGCRAD